MTIPHFLPDPSAPGASLLGHWRRFSRFPGGAALFSRFIGFRVPYTGALGARVRTLEPGHAVVVLRTRRGVRNHLGSAHAVALTNLGEFAGGLSVLTALPPEIRGIVLRLESEYLKKGRGTLTAECRWPPASAAAAEGVPFPTHPGTSLDRWAHTVIRDEAGDEVARVGALWRLGWKAGAGA